MWKTTSTSLQALTTVGRSLMSPAMYSTLPLGWCSASGVGSMSRQTTRSAPRSSSISMTRLPTMPLPPVTMQARGAGHSRLATAGATVSIADRSAAAHASAASLIARRFFAASRACASAVAAKRPTNGSSRSQRCFW